MNRSNICLLHAPHVVCICKVLYNMLYLVVLDITRAVSITHGHGVRVTDWVRGIRVTHSWSIHNSTMAFLFHFIFVLFSIFACTLSWDIWPILTCYSNYYESISNGVNPGHQGQYPGLWIYCRNRTQSAVWNDLSA